MNQRTLDFRSVTSPLIRVLFSEPSDHLLREYLAEIIHSVYPNFTAVATVTPSGIREDDLLKTAAKQRFDVAILLLNNISYAPYRPRRRSVTLTSDGVFLTKRMRRLFKMPIIALFGWPDDPSHVATLLQAGATAALKLPFPREVMEEALRKSLLRSPSAF